MQVLSTIFQDFSLFNGRFIDTITKGDINSFKFYEKSKNMLGNIMKNVVNASRAIIAQNNANLSRTFPLFYFKPW